MSEEKFCEGCGVAFKEGDYGPIHETDYCRDLLERKVMRERAEKAEARVATLERLLSEAMGWLEDPSRYHGTRQSDRFNEEVAQVLGATERHGDAQGQKE